MSSAVVRIAMVAGEAWQIVSIQPDVNKRRFVDIVLERAT